MLKLRGEFEQCNTPSILNLFKQMVKEPICTHCQTYLLKCLKEGVHGKFLISALYYGFAFKCLLFFFSCCTSDNVMLYLNKYEGEHLYNERGRENENAKQLKALVIIILPHIDIARNDAYSRTRHSVQLYCYALSSKTMQS